MSDSKTRKASRTNSATRGKKAKKKDAPVWHRYAEDVASGKITACVWARQACERYLKDLNRKDLEFREEAAEKGIRFIRVLKHFKGKSVGQPFELEPFQAFIVANLLGWYWKKTGDEREGRRRYTAAYIEMARKGGKTALIAALAMYYLIADGEAGAEIDIAANNFEQAKRCFEFIEKFGVQLDPKGKDLRVFRSSVELPSTSGKVYVFSSDDKGKDGFNASVGIIDEYHSAPNTKMRDVIKSSMVMRENPMLLTITSAGFDRSLPCYQLRQTCSSILAGLKEDDSMFAIIFGLDEGDDWLDEKLWIKANPNLGTTVTVKALREQVVSARNNPSEEVSVRTKNLGEWLTTNDIWIPERYILDCSVPVELDDFKGCDTYVGVDLASVSDMTAVSYLMVKDDEEGPMLYFKNVYFLPEAALDESPNRDRYRIWKRTGQLVTTPGNVTDYQWVTNEIHRQSDNLFLQRVLYDPWNATSWATQMTEIRMPMEPYTQNIGNFNRPTKEFERLCRSGRVRIDNNEITRWMFANVSLKTDHNGNVKPNKGAGKDKKIDGVVAMLTALGGWLLYPPRGWGIY